MYCRKCYSDLSEAKDGRCPACRKPFDPSLPSTFCERPFPRMPKVVLTVVLTTVLAGLVAAVVSVAQWLSVEGSIPSGH